MLHNLSILLKPKLTIIFTSSSLIHGRRAFTSPYPYTPSLLVQALLFYQHIFHTCTLLSYPSTFSPPRTLKFTYTFFTNFPLSVMVQWSSAWVCKPRVVGSNLCYSLTTFHSLISPQSGQRLPKLLSYCPQTGLTMLYASEALVAISLARFQHIQERM